MVRLIGVRRVALSAVLTVLPTAAAMAQGVDTSQDESPALIAFLVAFSALVIGLLAFTARKMAKLP